MDLKDIDPLEEDNFPAWADYLLLITIFMVFFGAGFFFGRWTA
jgi:hypothetical protein